MDFNIEEAKQLFIKEGLDQHGEFLMDLLMDEIATLDIIDTQNLIQQLRYNIAKRGSDWILQLSFPGYGRAVEIGYYKRIRNYNSESNSVVKQLFNIQSLEDVKNKKARRQARKLNWYSKNVYGSLNKLYGKLMYGFSEDEIQRLKKIITSEAFSATESGYIGPPTFST